MYGKKREIELIREWINSGVFCSIVAFAAQYQKDNEIDELGEVLSKLNDDKIENHKEAITDLGRLMTSLAEDIPVEECPAVKAVTKHTAYIANELSGPDSDLYTMKGGSWLLGIDMMNNINGIKTDRGIEELEKGLKLSQLNVYFQRLENRCDLEKRVHNKMLGDEEKKKLSEDIRIANGNLTTTLGAIEEKTKSSQLKSPNNPKLFGDINERLYNETYALLNNWDVTRLSDVDAISKILDSAGAFDDQTLRELKNEPELSNFMKYNKKLNKLHLFDPYSKPLEDEDAVFKSQDQVDEFYVDFFDTVNKMYAEMQKPSVRKTVEKLNEKGVFKKQKDNIILKMYNNDPECEFVLENTNLSLKNYSPQADQKNVSPAEYHTKLRIPADRKAIESFADSLDSVINESNALYESMKELKKKNTKSSLQFQKMERALIRAKSMSAKDQSPEEILGIIFELGTAADNYVRERGKKANSIRLDFGKKISTFAKESRVGLKAQMNGTVVGNHSNLTLSQLKTMNNEREDLNNDAQEISIRESRKNASESFYRNLGELENEIMGSLLVFTQDPDHYYSADASASFKAMYEAADNAKDYLVDANVSKPKEVIESLYSLAEAADKYDKEHSGITNINKGVGKKGRNRLDASRDISKNIKNKINLLMGYYSELHGIKENESLGEYHRRTKLEIENLNKPTAERMNEQEIQNELTYKKNYDRGKTIQNKYEYVTKSNFASNVSNEVVASNIAIDILKKKHGAKSVLDEDEFEKLREKLKSDDVIKEIAKEDRNEWYQDGKIDHEKILKLYNKKNAEYQKMREDQKKQRELEKQQKANKESKKESERASKDNYISRNIIDDSPKKKNDSINIIDDSPKKNNDSINIIDDSPKKNNDSINIIHDLPKKNDSSINIMEDSPKKNAPESEPIISEKSPFFKQQKNIAYYINEAPPKNKKQFDDVKEYIGAYLAEILAKNVLLSTNETKEFNKSEFIHQFGSKEGNLDEMHLAKQIFNSKPMQDIIMETKTLDDLVKLGKSALSKNAQPFIMNYGLRNHKEFEKQNTKSENNNSKELNKQINKNKNFVK